MGSCKIVDNFSRLEGENIGIEKETAARQYEREFEQIQNPVIHNNESGGEKISTIFMGYFKLHLSYQIFHFILF